MKVLISKINLKEEKKENLSKINWNHDDLKNSNKLKKIWKKIKIQ